ncbi:hypothetical protein ABPG77_007751 [Micractinium sp. CCAP 211/92]
MPRGKSKRRRQELSEDEDPQQPASGSENEDEGQGDKRKGKKRRGGRGHAASPAGPPAASHLVSSFFQGHAAVAGSRRTLADLQLEGLAGETGDDAAAASLRDLLAALPERHAAEKAALRRRLAAQFGRWWAQLRAGNSLLFYGFGSKHELLQRFAREQLGRGDGACLSVNGLQPGLTAKQVLQWAVAAVKQTKAAHYRGCSPDDLLDLLASDERRLYIMLHNIDGPGLRSHEGQRLLSELARLPRVHLAASVDHVNAALLWGQQTRDRFAWVWHNATTYAPYLREVGFAAIPSLLVGRSEQCSKQSATVVLASLSHSAREVFRLVAEAQLDPAGDRGVTFQRLFQLCRERFLVSNEMLLKSFLTEYRDHELLGTRRGADGAELLHVPLEETVLQQVLADVEAMS